MATVETFAVCFNEALMLPYFMRHYSQFGSVTIFDNFSTDDSVKIARDMGAIVYQFDTGGEFREDIMTELRNDCWKGSKADWVIVVDIDEFVYHPDLLNELENTKGTVLLPRMFQMHSLAFPTTTGRIYDEIQWGVEFNAKMSVFRPDQIRKMNYEVGCHFARPEGNFELNFKSPIIEMHFRNMGIDYLLYKNQFLNARQSEVNRRNNWNWHYSTPEQQTIREFEHAMKHLIKVI
jgi:glycosyltransferase involved in cell wall biosynthesis